MNLRGLKTNGDSKYYHAFLVKIADPDSPSDALDLTATATSSKVAVSIEAVDGVADTYKLTVLFKEEKPSEVTFKLADSATFAVTLKTVQFPGVPSAIAASEWKDFPVGAGSDPKNSNYFGSTRMKRKQAREDRRRYSRREPRVPALLGIFASRECG